MKCLVVEMSDKTQWAIPAMLIAKHRAEHYTEDAKKALAEIKKKCLVKEHIPDKE